MQNFDWNKVKDVYDGWKGRNTNEQVIPGFCPHVTAYYLKGGSYESGSHMGRCGTKKDNNRIYLCEQCQSKGHY